MGLVRGSHRTGSSPSCCPFHWNLPLAWTLTPSRPPGPRAQLSLLGSGGLSDQLHTAVATLL